MRISLGTVYLLALHGDRQARWLLNALGPAPKYGFISFGGDVGPR